MANGIFPTKAENVSRNFHLLTVLIWKEFEARWMRLNFVFARRARVQAKGSTWTEYRRLRGEPNKERWSGEKKKPKGSDPPSLFPSIPCLFRHLPCAKARKAWKGAVNVINQKRVRVFDRGIQTPRNRWKHEAVGRVLLLFRGVWRPRSNTTHEFLIWLLKLFTLL